MASTVATRRVDERLAAYGLTVRQYGLLAQLSLEPELTMAELARQLGIARQSVHQLVSELVRAGHVRRRPGADERSRRLEITDTAHYLLTRIDGPLERVETELLGALAPDEAETLRSLLQRVLAMPRRRGLATRPLTTGPARTGVRDVPACGGRQPPGGWPRPPSRTSRRRRLWTAWRR
ncbi:MarR family winged helix-turn-helix transcriptional regulator [Streptomyces sp. SM18]|uniref:MarR family winged helix-turn-helix transcriptional regulator n=1 Tax=Streptomyces sp. SM18 TaxID=1736046 RepID=UPI001C641138|nr:MarR family winged helix-turn-helix transcriptional regulator [Streptomyces sp. SM18]